MSGPRVGGRRAVAAAVAAAIALGLAGAGALVITPAAAGHRAQLDLQGQTAFVGRDPAVIELRAIDAAPDDRIRVRIFAPRASRDALRATYDAVPDESELSIFEPSLDGPLDQVPVVSFEIPDDEIGELIRRDDGALPVVIDLLAADDTVLDTLITHLLVIGNHRSPTLSVAFVADLTVPLGLQPDQSVEIDGPALVQRARALPAGPDLPLTVELRPETLQALDASDQASFVDLIMSLEGRSLLRSPWVDLDEEGWRRAGEADRVIEQYALGIATVEEHLNISPSTIARLDADGTADTLGLFRTTGTTGVIVESSQLSGATRVASRYQPVRLFDANGLPITAVAVEVDLHDTLTHPDPELAGHRALAELAIHGVGAEVDLGLLIEVDDIDPAALRTMLSGMDQRDFLRTLSVEQLFLLDPARTTGNTLFRGELLPTVAPDLAARAADLQLTRGLVEAYSAMVAPADAPIVPLRTQLLAAAAAELTESGSRTFTSRVFDSVLDGTSGLSIVPSERITLTDRQTDLPLTLRNDQPLPITVDLILSAEKLRFPDGERVTIVLQPGNNDRTIRVETLASGDARVTATLTSPGGRLELATGTVDIRSTAISGLGLIISIAALLVLGGWWGRTIVRVRRRRFAATVAADSNTGPDQPQGES